MKMKLGRKGFTLVEMLVVVVIVGVLVAIALPRFFGATQQARIEACNANVRAMTAACEVFNARNGSYPASLAELEAADAGGHIALPDGIPVCPVNNDAVYALYADGDRVVPHNH